MVATEAIDGKARRRLATRERLYEAAIALITERGYEATTFDDIAARADTSRRTPFNHFPTKSDITFEWARRRRAQAADAAKATDPHSDMLDQLRAYFHELAVITESRPAETRQMLFGYLRACGPVLNRTPMAQELRPLFSGDLGSCAEAGSTINLAAELLYDVYQGVLWRWMRDADPPVGSFTTELDAVIEVALRGISSEVR